MVVAAGWLGRDPDRARTRRSRPQRPTSADPVSEGGHLRIELLSVPRPHSAMALTSSRCTQTGDRARCNGAPKDATAGGEQPSSRNPTSSCQNGVISRAFPASGYRVLADSEDRGRSVVPASPRLGAALAYYSVFSLGPLLLIVTSVAGLFFGAEAVRGSLTAQFRSLLGETGGKAVEAMLAGASSLQAGRQAAVLGSLLLLVAALGVV